MNPIAKEKEKISKMLAEAVRSLISDGVLVGQLPRDFAVEIPADAKNGDFSSNFALVSAKIFRQPPQKIAEWVAEKLSLDHSHPFFKIEVAGPGFLNFFEPAEWFGSVVRQVESLGADYGRSEVGAGERVMVEFVSANPTGPMHIGNARGGALGDTLAAAFSFAGYDAYREFYINDAGNQIQKLGKSLEARYLQILQGEGSVIFPEDGYQGEDIKEWAQRYIDTFGSLLLQEDAKKRQRALAEYVIPQNVQKMKADLEKYRITYDNWFSEQSLYDEGLVQKMIAMLRESPYTYESEGALWFRSSDFGSEKDDVLVRANGIPTYYVVDVAYHYNKFVTRKFSRSIDVWGADHHGHVARMKNALSAVGVGEGRLEVVLIQLVRLIREGEAVRMSKRTGKSITLDNLLEEVPVDAARFFFNLSSPSVHLDFDLDLAVSQSSENPVYYVQYAHARICSIFKNLAAEGILARTPTNGELELLQETEERDLIRQIALLPEEIIAVTRFYDPSRLTRYSMELASRFHKFYAKHRIKEADEGLRQARLALCGATRTALRNTLALLKVDAPEIM